MPRNCKIHIQIDSGTIRDAESYYGFFLMDSDDIVVPPVKDYETQAYPEASAVEIYPYTTFEPFDYSCSILAVGDLATVNASIQAFYDSLFEITPGTDVRKALPITVYNEWKGVKLTGYAKTNPAKDNIPNLTTVEKGAYLFDFIIFVADPRTLLPWNNT